MQKARCNVCERKLMFAWHLRESMFNHITYMSKYPAEIIENSSLLMTKKINLSILCHIDKKLDHVVAWFFMYLLH